MEGRSRNSLVQARERQEAVLAGLDAEAAARLGDELAAVAGLVDGNFALRRALSDDDAPAGDRSALAVRVVRGQVSDSTSALLADVVGLRWSSPLDLTSALSDLAAEAVLASAEKDNVLDEVEDELFRFARILDRAAELSLALSNPALPADRKSGLLNALLEGKAQAATVSLVRAALATTGGRGLEARLDRLTVLAAGRRNRLVAVVRVASSLNEDQATRLRAALAKTYGRDVHLQIDVDPHILGGAVVQVGDEILDGSVARRIDQARARLA